MQNTFLARLYRVDKILFLIVILYLVGVLYYSLRQREEFPFLLYGMYSLKESPQPTYTTYSIELNGKELKYSSLFDSKNELILSPLERLAPNIDSLSDTDKTAFQSWLLHQCKHKVESGDKIEVYKRTCSYNTQGQPFVLSNQKLFTYAGQ